jgi:hypothetical protein
VKSISMIPPVIEVGVKNYLYNIYFKVEKVDVEGWNEELSNRGKRASVDLQMKGGYQEKGGKNQKTTLW